MEYYFIQAFASQTQFLLEAMGISFQPNTSVEESNGDEKFFQARSPFQASIKLQDGRFILQTNSIIQAPLSKTKGWSDGWNFHKRSQRRYTQLIDSGKAIKIDETTAKLVDDFEFTSPSTPAGLCSGVSQKGWKFWQGLDEKRKKEI